MNLRPSDDEPDGLPNCSPAIVHDDATLVDGVTVEPCTVIEAGVQIGAESRIGSHCLIGHTEPDTEAGPLTVGSGAVIRSYSVIYSGSTFGDGLETGHYVAIRERTAAGKNLRIGTGSDLRGDLTIGDYARINGRVSLGKHSSIEDFVWLFPSVVLTNDPHPPNSLSTEGATVRSFAVIGTGGSAPVVVDGLRVKI